MTTKSWINTSGGSWSNSANWSQTGTLAVPPASGDVVLIEQIGTNAANYKITGNAGGTGAMINGGTVVVGDSHATLSLEVGSTLTVGKLFDIGYAYNAGTLTPNGSGAFNLSKGWLNVKGTSASAIQFDATETITANGTLTDAGGMVVAGGNFTQSGGSATINGTAAFNGGASTISGGSFSAAGLSINSGVALALNGGVVTETHDGLLTPANVSISSGGSIIMGGGTLFSNDGISDNGVIAGSGKITGMLSGNGVVTASGGALDLVSAISNDCPITFQIGTGSSTVLQVDGLLGTGNKFQFLGASGSLFWNQALSIGSTNAVTGMNVGANSTPTNFIELDDNVTVVGSNAHNGTSANITLSDGLLSTTFTLSGITGNTSGTWFVNTISDGHGGTDIFLSTVCFAAGTHILTTDGERPVETLSPGDSIRVLAGEDEALLPAVWIGRRRIDLRTHPRLETVAPIRIRQSAFAENVPHRDLLVSPDHALFVEGKLIAARQLVNGATIVQEKGWESVEYFHVELDRHAVLLAEGLPAESYLDTGNRGFFANSGAPLILHPDLMDERDNPERETASCAPFVWDEQTVRPVWQRLAERAAALGQRAAELPTTTEPGLHLLSQGRRVRPVYAEGGLFIFPLPRGAAEVQLVSRAAAPADTRPWLDDRRSLGVNVARLIIRDAEDLVEIPVDHPGLADGWWNVERYGPALRRWTNGAARLPLPRMGAPAMLEVHLAGEMVYPVAEMDAAAPQRRVA